MSEQELQAIREFLERVGLSIREVEFGYQAFVMDMPVVNAQTELGICRSALWYFLSTQLGIHWRRTHIDAQLHIHRFDSDLERQIRQAIDYLEKLEKVA